MLKFICILAFIGLASAIHGHSGYSHVIKHDSHYGGHNEHYTGGYYGNGHHNTGHYDAGHYSGHHGDHFSSPNYSFDYGVKDPHTGDNKKQWETRHGDVVKGGYMLHEADGTKRVVEYTADKHHGFNAIVKKIGHAHHPHTNAKHWDGHYGGHYNGGYNHGHSHGHGHGATSWSHLYQH